MVDSRSHIRLALFGPCLLVATLACAQDSTPRGPDEKPEVVSRPDCETMLHLGVGGVHRQFVVSEQDDGSAYPRQSGFEGLPLPLVARGSVQKERPGNEVLVSLKVSS